MKILFKISLIFLALNICAQTKFDAGYSSGFEKGYCFNKSGCIPPIVPIAPLPTINEDFNSFNDGYSRGFVDGQNAGVHNGSDRPRYQTSKPDYVDFSRKTNPELMRLLALAVAKKKETHQRVSNYLNEIYDEISSYDDRGSEQMKRIKEVHLNLLLDLSKGSAAFLKRTHGNYQQLVDNIDEIYENFSEQIEKANE